MRQRIASIADYAEGFRMEQIVNNQLLIQHQNSNSDLRAISETFIDLFIRRRFRCQGCLITTHTRTRHEESSALNESPASCRNLRRLRRASLLALSASAITPEITRIQRAAKRTSRLRVDSCVVTKLLADLDTQNSILKHQNKERRPRSSICQRSWFV